MQIISNLLPLKTKGVFTMLQLSTNSHELDIVYFYI